MNYKTENIKQITVTKPLKLDCGQTIKDFPIAYETYGKLNEKKNNAILIFHALSGDQFVAGTNPVTSKDGWWNTAVGSRKAVDTEKYFVICANVLGGCMGSFGPKNINDKDGEPYGLKFPVITIRDMIRAQESLLEYFGIAASSLSTVTTTDFTTSDKLVVRLRAAMFRLCIRREIKSKSFVAISSGESVSQLHTLISLPGWQNS